MSPQFEEFQEATAELQQVKLHELQNDLQRCAFFLNIYNTLSLHSYIADPSQMKGSQNTRVKFMKKFQYKVHLLPTEPFCLLPSAFMQDSRDGLAVGVDWKQFLQPLADRARCASCQLATPR